MVKLRVSLILAALCVLGSANLAAAQCSPTTTDGTTLPPATSICAPDGSTWTNGGGTSPNISFLRNSTDIGILGVQLEMCAGTLYIQGDDFQWYSWNGSGVVFVSASTPSVCGAPPVSGSAYHVSLTGSDARSCAQAQDMATPLRTLAAAVPCVTAGETLYVHGGVWDEAITYNGNSGTSWSNVVRIAAYPGDTVILKPSVSRLSTGASILFFDCNCHYIEIDGLNFDQTNYNDAQSSGVVIMWTLNGRDPHHIRVKNGEVFAGRIGIAAAVVFGEHCSLSTVCPNGQTGANEAINLKIHGGGLTGCVQSNAYLCASYGVYLSSPNNLVENCDIYDTAGAGIQIYNADSDDPANNIVRNNRIHDITRAGFISEIWGIVVVGNNNQIYNNIFYNITFQGNNPGDAVIAVDRTGNKIWNNTIYNGANKGILVAQTAVNAEIRNNIINTTADVNYENNSATTTFTNNLCQSGCPTTNGNANGNPLFTSPSTGNFVLLVGSPAIDTGFTVSAFAVDIVGITRPQGPAWDKGAHEYIVVSLLNYYVSNTNGSDSRTCAVASNISTPKASINSALSCLAPGATVFVRGGSYNETLMDVIPSGTNSQHVKITAYPGETVWLHPSSCQFVVYISNAAYIDLDGLNLDGEFCLYDTFKIDSNRTVWGEGHHITVQNAEFLGTLHPDLTGLYPAMNVILLSSWDPSDTGFVSFTNLKIHRAAGADIPADFAHGMYINLKNTTVEKCEIWDVPGTGIQVFSAHAGLPDNVVLKNNIIRDLDRNPTRLTHRAITISTGSNNQVYNNLAYNIQGNANPPPFNGNVVPSFGAIVVAIGATGTTVYHNTVVGTTGAYGIYLNSDSSGSTVRNNISYGNELGDIVLIAGGSATVDHNLCSAGCNINADPQFTNPAIRDYSIQNGSPAQDAGLTIGSVTNDILYVPRPQGAGYDIGAYEADASGGCAPISVDLTFVPPATRICDTEGAAWTLGTGTAPSIQILRNGADIGVLGVQVGLCGGVVFVQGDDYNWYRWVNSAFAFESASSPCASVVHPAGGPVQVLLIRRGWLRTPH